MVLLLVDHSLATWGAVSGLGWVEDVRWLTRPSLPLFMVVSGTLVAHHWKAGRLGVLRHQAWRVLPFALVATVAAAYATKFNQPEPLTVYLLGLPALWVFRRWPLLGCGLLALVALNVHWPLASYDPAEQAAWLLAGVALYQHVPGWWDRGIWPGEWWLSKVVWLGRRTLWLYTGQLVALAVLCTVMGWPRGWS